MNAASRRALVRYLVSYAAAGGQSDFVERTRVEIENALEEDDRRLLALEERILALEERDTIRARRNVIPLTKPADGIHEAGPLVDGIQQCRRCSGVLCDYRGAMQLDGDPPLRGFAPGAHVEVDGPGSFLTDAAPTCGANT